MQKSSIVVAKIVQAGAGTGKTESLAREIIFVARTLYAETGKIPRLIATTFTERATAELRERVIKVADDEVIRNTSLELAWLKDFVQDPERLQILTIHGVFSKILHGSGSLLGLDPEFKILKIDEEQALLKNALRSTISAFPDIGNILDQFGFEESLAIVERLFDHYRMFKDTAKPRAHWKEELDASLVELLKAAKIIAEDSGDDLPPKLLELTIILKNLWTSQAIQSGEYVSSRKNFLEALEGVRKQTPTKRGAHLKEPLGTVFEIRDKWQEHAFDPDVNLKFLEMAELWETLARKVFMEIQLVKKSQGLLSFSDLEFLTAELIEEFPQVKLKVSRFYDYWFVDEFQDTSPLQKKLIFSFLREPWNGYFVGDPQQSIYLFRGAALNVFEETKKEIAARAGEILKLETNYRSKPDLLKFMNLIFPPLEAVGEIEGKILTHIYLHGKNVSEGDLIQKQIQSWLSEGLEFQDIAILVRTNREAKNLAIELSGRKFPVFVHTTGGFYDKREVIDALCLLSFLVTPHDNQILITLLRSPWINIADPEIVRMAQGAKIKKISIWDFAAGDSQLKTLKLGRDLTLKLPLSVLFEKLLIKLGFFEFCTIEDASGKREANLRKLVSSLRQAETKPGFSASRFIQRAWEEVDDEGDENEAPGFIQPKRINIMTIHKSKGLKFNAVILPKCGKSYSVKHQRLEFAPDGEWASQVMHSSSEEKVSPMAMVFLKAQRAEREVKEASRLFYVAVTRAARRLCLISEKEFGAQSWLAPLALNWEEGIHDSCYEVSHVGENLEPMAAFESKDLGLANAERSLPFKTNLVEETELLSVESHDTFLSDLDFDHIPNVLKSQQCGLALHYVFEELRRFQNVNLDELCIRAQDRFGLKDEMNKSAIEQTLNILVPPMGELLKTGFTEWGFTFKNAGQYYSGRIDIWGEVDGKVWIVDYKSALKITSQLKEKVHSQLEFYALAVHKSGVPWNKINLAVLLPQSGQVEVLPLRSVSFVSADLSYRNLDRLIQDQSETLIQIQ